MHYDCNYKKNVFVGFLYARIRATIEMRVRAICVFSALFSFFIYIRMQLKVYAENICISY